MEKLSKFLADVGKDEEWAIHALTKYLEQQAKKKERARKYYEENKEELDEYHKNYAATHPEYRRRAIARAQRARKAG